MGDAADLAMDMEMEYLLGGFDDDELTYTRPRGRRMAVTSTEKKTCITPEFRLGYNSLFNPKVKKEKNDDGTTTEKKEWVATMIFDNDEDLSEMKKLAKAAAQKKWGDKLPHNYKSPFMKGEDRRKEDGTIRDEYKNKIVIYAKNKFKPPGIVNEANEVFQDQAKLYSGCYCVASVVAFTWGPNQGASGVSFGLEHIRKIGDGEPLSSSSDPSEVFKDVKPRHGVITEDDDDDSI